MIGFLLPSCVMCAAPFHQSSNPFILSPARCMKLPPLFATAGLMLLCGCNSLDSPLSNLNVFRTGHDGRVYNPQTNEYEWPDKSATPRPKAAAASGKPGRAPASPPPTHDDRPYDPIKNEFKDPPIN
jgi:hypothetical protein